MVCPLGVAINCDPLGTFDCPLWGTLNCPLLVTIQIDEKMTYGRTAA
jgi:hypothetical protein